MFTGIVEQVGTVVRADASAGAGRRLIIRHRFGSGALTVGDSVAHDGVCLTATRVDGDTYAVDVGPETVSRTTIGGLQAGASVNLELAATLATRLGGHLVQGHVDGVGRISSMKSRANAWDLEVEVAAEVLALVIPRGSVTVDGISLTVTGRSARAFSVSIIPHTWKSTGLVGKKVGGAVNVEVDLIARYVAGLLEGYQGLPGTPSGLTESFLRQHGFGGAG